MTKIGLFIFAFEIYSIYRLEKKYYREGEKWPVPTEEILPRMNLEDIIKLMFHARQSFLGLCIATMGRLFNV